MADEPDEVQGFIVNISKLDGPLMNWLMAACSTDKTRIVLQGTMTDGKNIFASDGWVMHAGEHPESLNGHEGEIVAFTEAKPRKSGGRYVADEVRGTYPDPYHIISETRDNDEEYSFEVNPKFLIRALEGFEAPVRLRFYGQNHPMTVEHVRSSASRRFALIMPVHDYNGNVPWVPEPPEPPRKKKADGDE